MTIADPSSALELPEAFTPATRDEALRRLDAFIPSAGRHYAARRNYDLGPGRHEGVSLLSPYVRRRMVSERELVKAALQAHGDATAEKFIQEVFWRSYWKGWLELRPEIWTRYTRERDKALTCLDSTPGLATDWRRACSGATGIACFDHWAQELVGTGYLHNHARMRFASIWIFTLNLPWELGADFFLRYLLDGDPASNTLSWRWVAGLQTKGKTYLAREENIAEFTEGRFPVTPGLAEEATVLHEPDIPAPRTMPDLRAPDPGTPTALLLTEEDLTPQGHLGGLETSCGLFALKATDRRSPLPVSRAVQTFTTSAMSDAANRLQPELGVCQGESDLEKLARALLDSGARQVVTAYAPTGPTTDALLELEALLAREGVALRQVRRDWDSLCWPNATHGFFRFKKKIPELIEALC